MTTNPDHSSPEEAHDESLPVQEMPLWPQMTRGEAEDLLREHREMCAYGQPGVHEALDDIALELRSNGWQIVRDQVERIEP